MNVFFGHGSGEPAADRRYDMARTLAAEGDFAAATDLLSQALELAPLWPPLHFERGEMLRKSGALDDARTAFAAYLLHDPDDRMGAAIKLALINKDDTLAAMPAEYVRALFDQYAPRFDDTLLNKLSYRTPSQIYDAVNTTGRNSFLDTLDLGCGTGLAAEMFRNHTNRIVGVDISPVMIDMARKKNIYDALHVAEVGDFLKGCEETFDLILSADVFVYLGALENTFQLVAKCLAPDGVFAFSVQTCTGDSYMLGMDHRFSHSHAYVAHCIDQAGLRSESVQSHVLRMDGGQPVDGWVFVCRKF